MWGLSSCNPPSFYIECSAHLEAHGTDTYLNPYEFKGDKQQDGRYKLLLALLQAWLDHEECNCIANLESPHKEKLYLPQVQRIFG